MPRVSEVEKRKSHSRIVKAAAQLFRQNGIETTSVAEVMNAAGLTHGGFYRHFESKEELATAAFAAAVSDVTADIETTHLGEDPETRRAAYIKEYLSADHLENLGAGCPIAALGSELVRADPTVKTAANDAVSRMIALLNDKDTTDKGYTRLSLLVGAVTIARLSLDPAQRDAILKAATTELTEIS